MKKAVITITDVSEGRIDLDIDFGGDIDRESEAHVTALWFLWQIHEADDYFTVNQPEES